MKDKRNIPLESAKTLFSLFLQFNYQILGKILGEKDNENFQKKKPFPISSANFKHF